MVSDFAYVEHVVVFLASARHPRAFDAAILESRFRGDPA
jgi:hypothetical protein